MSTILSSTLVLILALQDPVRTGKSEVPKGLRKVDEATRGALKEPKATNRGIFLDGMV